MQPWRLRVGIEFGLAVIDLRFVCSAPADYANPIEPSSVWGPKIARAIVSLVSAGHKGDTATRVLFLHHGCGMVRVRVHREQPATGPLSCMHRLVQEVVLPK